MKIPGLIALALLSGGCALFQGEAASEAALIRQPATSPAPTRTAFRPAFGVGQPVALIPCTGGVAISGDCRNRNDRHQARGDLAEDAEQPVFTEAATVSVAGE